MHRYRIPIIRPWLVHAGGCHLLSNVSSGFKQFKCGEYEKMIYIENGKTPIIIHTNKNYQRKCITQEGILYCEKSQIQDIPPPVGLILAGSLIVCMIVGSIRVASDFGGTIGDYIMGAMTGFIVWLCGIFILSVFGVLISGVL